MPNQPSENLDVNDPKAQAEQARALLARKLREQPSLTEKSRRLGERIIEAGIRSIAALSIIFIFLIFFFIFREASPIILGTSPDKDEAHAQISPDDYRLPGELPVTADTTSTSADTGTAPSLPGDTATAGEADIDVYNPNDTVLASLPTTSSEEEAGLTQVQKDSISLGIVGEDYPILTHDSAVKLRYLLHDNWQPNSEHPRYGIYPILIGTLKTTIVALLIGAPLAILAALYTAFFAPRRLREIIKPIIELLAGFPSVVLGFFCLMTVASLVQGIFGNDFRLNSVVGGIGLALAVIPIIYTITDDALRAIPMSLREAALALGASEWQAAYQVMLPAATPGIFAAVLLGLGRAFGETMIALMATGNAGTFSWDFFEPVRTFAATIGAEMGEVVFGSPHYQLLFLLGVILFVFSFIINFVTEFYVKQRLIKKFRGTE